MRVLMISDVYFPRINGVSTSIQTFRADLAGAGVESLLVAPAYPAPWPHDEGLLRVPSLPVPFDPEDRLMRPGALRESLRSLRSLRGRRFDLVHIHTPFIAHVQGRRLARELGLPVVETYHTYFEDYLHHYLPFLPGTLLKRLARDFSRRECNAVDAVVVPSRAMLQVLTDYGVSTPMHIIPTGIPLAAFWGGDGARFRARHGIAPERPLLVHVGRVAHEKNIGFLLRMLGRLRRELPEVLLLIAGDGPAVPALRRQVNAEGLEGNVRFVGYLERDSELKDCYRAGDAFVFASRSETQGLVLLEAMALGVPVISTAVLGTVDILEQAQGAMVVPEDEAAFAAAARAVLTDPPRRQALARGALIDSERWSSEAMARRMLALYESVCGGTAMPDLPPPAVDLAARSANNGRSSHEEPQSP